MMEAIHEKRERLLALIRDRALLKEKVKLSSGQESNFYLDMKMIELFPEGSFLIGEVMFNLLEELDIAAIGGLAVGAVPMVTSIVECCYRKEKEIEGFFVRDEIKKHGTMKRIEGNFSDGARVVLVDDVVTTGRSIDKAIDAVTERGAEIVAIFSIVDRDAGAKEHFAEKGIEYRSVFTKSDVLADAHVTA
jgi:orotate phosphoribosyltransferase